MEEAGTEGTHASGSPRVLGLILLNLGLPAAPASCRLARPRQFPGVLEASPFSLIGRRRLIFEGLAPASPFGPSLAQTGSVMDPLTALAASGLRARMESLDLLANNLANASTGGFKADREFYGLYSATETDQEQPAAMPVIERQWTDYSQGALRPSGNALDVALDGSGFFVVNGPSGPLYTRNGSFRLAADGKLTTQDGLAVRGRQGAALVLDTARKIEISADGTVTQEGNVIGQLELADFTSTAGLAKQGANYFRAADPKLTASAPAGTKVAQGQLETSNSGPAEGAVRLVSVLRQFEMLQKAVSLGTEMNKRALEEVAKV